MKSLNLGILAHVDAGKTSLTERLLFHMGAINKLGKVDSGDTQTDTLALERKRGITIQSSVVSFNLNNTKVNLIDTPGHADFISEVERALFVLDAVILVISAVEGIQPQTRILMRTLKNLKKPTLIFINKIDRKGARCNELIEEINTQLDVVGVPMVTAQKIASPEAYVEHLTTKNESYYSMLLESLASNDEDFLNECIKNDLLVSKDEFIHQIISQTTKTTLFPIYLGSAVTGVGIDELFVGIEYYLPYHNADSGAEPSGSIFKMERDNHGDKVAYINLRTGSIEARKPIAFYRITEEGSHVSTEKLSRLNVFEHGKRIDVKTASAGCIVQAYGLKDAAISDTLDKKGQELFQSVFSRPTLKVTIECNPPEDNTKLAAALKEIAEQDPLISLHQSSRGGVLAMSLYGEIQKEILSERLSSEYGLNVSFSETQMVCVERPVQIGAATHLMDLHNAPLEFYATLGFRIEPGEINSGLKYSMKGLSGEIPKGYHSVIEESVYHFMQSGLQGWQVTDCKVVLTEAGICPLSIAPHFRQLTPILLREALEKATTQVCEPYSHFELDVPLNLLNKIQVELSHFDARLISGNVMGDLYHIEGEILTKHLYTLQTKLPSITQGRGSLIANHGGYRAIS